MIHIFILSYKKSGNSIREIYTMIENSAIIMIPVNIWVILLKEAFIMQKKAIRQHNSTEGIAAF